MDLPWDMTDLEAPCWCGSGQEFAVCHHAIEQASADWQSVEAELGASRNGIERLYKYASTTYLEEILLQDKLYLSLPSDFNDPLECRIQSDVDGTLQEKRQFYFLALQARNGLSPEDAIVQADLWIRDGGHLDLAFWQDEQDEVSRRARVSDFRISCFSVLPDDPLLWGHYAANHQGVCLVFKTEGHFRNALRVTYSPEYPKVNFFRTPATDHLKAFALTKWDRWEYEKEYRIVRIANRDRGIPTLPTHLSFNPSHLEGIILGCEMDDQTRRTVLDIVKEREEPLRTYRAKLMHREWGIDIEEF